MSSQIIDGIPVFGDPDTNSVEQMKRCVYDGNAVGGALMADHHKGYSQPIGGVVIYKDQISPSGVGYDIGCGNKAVRTPLKGADVRPEIGRIMDEVFAKVSFGIGRTYGGEIDHPLFDDPAWLEVGPVKALRDKARKQLGTVGSGNHYVDVFVDENDDVWVGVHFGSRGLGHSIASGFLNLAAGRDWYARAPGEHMDQPPTVLKLSTSLGHDYMATMNLAGQYAYAGRDSVVSQVLAILGTTAVEEIHNHHNFAWVEKHEDETFVVVRKGATPNHAGQRSFIGGSMGDISAIVEGVDCPENKTAFNSTVHGAGRVMSRTQAAGKWLKSHPETGEKIKWGTKRGGGKVTREMMLEWLTAKGVELRGAGVDESPHCYKRLPDILAAHDPTIKIVHTLHPIGVAMAGDGEYDPWKD